METAINLKEQLKEAFDQFNSELNSVSPELINAAPIQGDWTIGQLAQHVVLATAGLPDKKNKPADRPADQLEPSIRETFLDYTRKFKSQEFLEPEKKEYQKEGLLSALKKNEELVSKITNEEKLDYVCLEVELPGWGYLTRYEWIKLIIYHVQRHTKQLKTIKETVGIAKQVK